MTSRELVIKTLEFDNPSRIPRQLWLLPWAQNHHPEQLKKIQDDYPDDIAGQNYIDRLLSHGKTIVGPILEQIQKAQVSYHSEHGVYAASFEQLEMVPSSDKYSYFLPADMVPAKGLFPKEGVDLSSLPEGVLPTASTDKFMVVAIGFAKPNSLEIWTMNQDKMFKEWSVPAGVKVTKDPSVSAQEPVGNMTSPFEGSLTWMIFLMGCTIGFALSVRNRMNFMLPSW